MNKVFEFILGLTIFLTACAYIPGQGMDTAQGIAFRLGIVSLLILSFYLKPIRFIMNRWVNSLLAWAFLSVLFLSGMPQAVAVNSFINIFLGVALFYVIVQYSDCSTILNAFKWVVAIHLIISALQVFHINTLVVKSSGGSPEMTGLFEYRYAMGVYMGVLTPFLIASKNRTFAILSGLLTIASMSYAAIGIMVLSCLGLTYKTRYFKACSISIIVATILVSMIAFSIPRSHPNAVAYKINSRLDVYKRFVPYIMQKPLGYGLGCFKHIGPMIAPHSLGYGDITDAWSDFFERTTEMGLLFLVLFGAVIVNVLTRGGWILLGIPLNMIFHSCFNHYNLCVLFIVLLALFEIKTQKVV